MTPFLDQTIEARDSARGSPLWLTNIHMDSLALVTYADGAIRERYDYTAFGVPMVREAVEEEKIGSRYTGRDIVLGSHYQNNRTRWYADGRWLSRDHLNYLGGVNLYAYMSNRPFAMTDPFGYWGEDIHLSLTTELARQAGFSCAGSVGYWAQLPDIDYRSPDLFHTFSGLSQLLAGNTSMLQAAQVVAQWHFPASSGGSVIPNSAIARNFAETGISNCDIMLFSEGLHTLEDSWSHQGTPYIAGVGHGRGWGWTILDVVYVGPTPSYIWGYGMLQGAEAAVSTSADDALLWPSDVRDMGIQVYDLMRSFAENCSCHCRTITSSRKTKTVTREVEPRVDVQSWLNTQYPGLNINER